MKKRILCLFLSAVMLLGLLPTQVLAAESIPLPEAELSEELTESGMFYLGSTSAELSEDENGWYLLRVARGGDALEASEVRLELVDVTANYGKDYKVALSDSGLTGPRVENADASHSLMDQIVEEGVQEDLQQDLALAGMSDEQIETALQEQADGFSSILSQELSAFAEAHPDRYLSQASDEDRANLAASEPDGNAQAESEDSADAAEMSEVPAVEATVRERPKTVDLDEDDAQASESQTSLSAAYEAQTGRKDDWKALSTDGSSILDASSLMMDYSMDAADAITEGLNSAYLDIPFAQGQTERIVLIQTIDNSKGQGDRIFMARLTACSDNAQVDVEHGRCMCTIADDEAWEAPVVSFAESSFDAKNGFVDVVIRREGILTPVSSVHLTTSDGSAVNGRDYSQVDADVAFPFGVSERTVHIPVRSAWLSQRSEFNLTLSDAKNCQIGEAASAAGVIEVDSESFVMTAASKAKEAGVQLMAYSGGIRYGDAIDLSKLTEHGVTYGSGSVWMEGTSCKIKADSGGLNDDRAWTYADWDIRKDIKCDGNIKALTGYKASGIEYNGISIKSSRNDDGKPQTWVVLWSAPDWYNDNTVEGSDYLTLGTDYSSWSSTEHRFYCDSASRSKQGVTSLRIWNSKADGAWRKNNTLTVEEVRPILRPFLVTAEIANPEALRYVDNQGNLVDYKDHDSAKSAGKLTLGGANTGENTVVKYVGDSIEVTCTGEYSYIQKLQITNSSGNSYAVTPTYKVGNKTAKFELDTSALRYLHNRNLITFSKNPDGDGYVGNLKLQVVMGKIPTSLTLNNNDQRGQVKLGFDLHNGKDNGTKKSGDDRNYNKIYRGDYVQFTESLNDAYKDSFTASTIRIKRERQANSGEAGFKHDAYETFDGNQTGWQVTMFNDYSAFTAWPSFQDIDNHIVVRVADKDKALFDTSGGVFTAKTIPGVSGYTDYEVVPQTSFAAHTFYPLDATPKDAAYVAVWKPANARDSYSQNTYYHEAQTEKSSNMITLTCQKAEATPFCVTGDAYYAALDLLTGVEGETWMPADGLTVMVTPAAYAISDDSGKFATVPFRGVAGCRVVMRTEAMGNVNYKYATLSKGVAKSVGTGDASVSAYTVPLGTFVVPVVNPNVPSINAASLSDNKGVAVETAAVWPDALSAQSHRYTFTATVVHDGTPYTDTDGTPRTEHVKGVEFLAYDGTSNTPRGELPGTVTEQDNGNGSKTFSLSLGLDMTEDNLNIYRPGDKIYVRLTTDRVRGNGKSVDETGSEVENPTLQETVYAPVYTGYDLVSAANFTPPELNINVLDTNMDDIFEKLPIFGSLNSTLRLSKLAVSEQALPNGGISLCIGYRLNTENDKEVKEFDEEFNGIKDATSKMMQWGKMMKSPPPMMVGVGNAGVNPFVGIYLDFGVDKDKQTSSATLTFIGGGLYVGCTGFFRVVMYFPVGPIPVYFGVEGDLTGYVNLGFQIPENAMTIDELQTADIDGLMDLDFKLKVQATMRFYVGLGLAGTLGVRGGLSFDMAYLYYPSVTNINPNYHKHGFTINLNLQVWVDAYIFSVPIPAKNLVHEAFGYAEDIENGGPTASLASAESDAPVTRQVTQPTGWLPGAGGVSLQSTLAPNYVTKLIGDNYPYADPQLLDTGNELVLVFLTTEALFGTSEKGLGDETTLAYSIYPYSTVNPEWSAPRRLGAGDTLKTGDFQPNVIRLSDYDGGALQVSWVSRKDVPWANDPEAPTTEERLDYLRQMEVYSAYCEIDGTELKVLECCQVTDDEYYNYDPQAIWTDMGVSGEKTVLFYQASEPGVKENLSDAVYTDFPNEESRQLLANVSPSQNGSFLMCKTYDADAGGWKGETDAGTFVVTPVNGQNRPVIADFTVQTYLFPTPAGDGMNYWALFAYTVDGDGNLSTPYDTELYLQLYDIRHDRIYDPIQLTDDATLAVSSPQFTEPRRFNCELFWYEAPDTSQEEHAYGKKNGDVQMLDIYELFLYGLDLDTERGTCGLKESISINELREMEPDAYNALEDKESLPASFPYSLHVKTVDIPETEEFEDGPTVASFMPYVDSRGEIYVIWLQSMTHEKEGADGTVQKVQTNEIYASALISDEDVFRESNLWTMPVRLTDDEQFYDEAALVHLAAYNELFVAANRYEFALEQGGGSQAQPVDRADFVMVQFDRAGSVEAVDIQYEPEMPQAGETVRVAVTLQNTGLLTAKNGGRYLIFPLIDGEQGLLLAEGSFDTKLLPGDTKEITFDYTMPEDLSGIGQIGFAIQSEETDFSTVSETRFTGEDAIQVGWSGALGNVETEEHSDGFYVTYELINTGNVELPAGAVQVKAGDSSAMDEQWAVQTLDKSLAPGEIAEYTVKLENVSDDFSTGFRRGVLMLTDAEGKELEDIDSSRDLILALTAPYNLVVNGDAELAAKGITLKTGEQLDLSGIYEGKSWYPDSVVLFAAEDSQVAASMDGTLYALAPGETTLIVKVNGTDGTMQIPVTVTEGDTPAPSGSGGGAAAASNPVNIPAAGTSATAHGKIISSASNARVGDTVTVTPQPDEGYVTTGVTVTDTNGNVIPVTKNADGTYSFTMPATAVTVTPSFAKVGEPTDSTNCPKDASCPISRFTDSKPTAWYHDGVHWALDEGIMNGTGDETFEPNGTTTRAMVVTMLWRLAGEASSSTTNPFSDVKAGSWYTDAVNWAAENSVVNGTSETTFSPNDPVTREQLAAILYRYAQAQGKGFEGEWMFQLDYPDADQVSQWADEAMHWMTMNGVITGMGDGTLAPKDNATRAQIATMFMRFVEAMEK